MMEEKSDRAERRAYLWWNDFRRGGVREDAGAFARLRRAENALDALIEPLAIELVRRLGFRGEGNICLAAELAVLLAHVRKNDTGRVASRLRGPGADAPLMSSIRFQRLLQAESGIERLTAFRRAVAMLGGQANVQDLAHAYLNLDHPTHGRDVRVRWLLRYAGERLDEQSGRRDEPTDNNDAEDAA